MRTKKSFIFLFILILGLTSCVSKKKYLEMESSKIRAEQRVRDLTGENEAKASRIEQLITDYEQMKQDLMASNAEKDQLINNLSGQINTLNSNVEEKDATIEEKLYSFEFEKRRLEEEIQSAKKAQEELKSDNQDLSEELKTTKDNLSDLQFEMNRKTEEVERLNTQLTSKGKEYEALSAQLATLKAEIQQLKNEGQEKDETIERLNNNVNLLKSQIGK